MPKQSLMLIQCVPNFSEGRRPDVIKALVEAVRQTPGVRLADWSADADHNRLVVTVIGPPEPVRAAALSAAAVAVAQIDLRGHQGVHPRLGALDVLPFVPVSGLTLADCAVLAGEVGAELSARHSLPVFLYEAASPDKISLPLVRKNAFQSLQPDFGPSAPHPTAGAAVVGARGPLIAYNITLAAFDLSPARTIARELRAMPEFPGLRTLGLRLNSRGKTQVSMNITQPAKMSMLGLYQYIERRAAELGTTALESEVVGAIPGDAAFAVLTEALHAFGLNSNQILWEMLDKTGNFRHLEFD